MSCQNVDFHNQCDHDISSEKTQNSGVRMSEFVRLSQGLCTCQLQLRPMGFEKAKIHQTLFQCSASPPFQDPSTRFARCCLM